MRLPQMTTGNWIFWSIIVWLGINFIWLGFFASLPAWIGAIIGVIPAFLILKYGPRPKE